MVPTIPAEFIRDAERAMMRKEALVLAEEKSRVRPTVFTGVMYEGKYIVGLAEQDVPGFTPIVYKTAAGLMATFPSYDAASAYADEMNVELGITKEQAIRVVLSSMRPDWTVGGLLKRKERKWK